MARGGHNLSTMMYYSPNMRDTNPTSNSQYRRLSKIIALLRENNRITHQTMAQANECSKKTVQRDIESLKANGWPIEFDKQGHFLSTGQPTDLQTSRNNVIATLILTGCTVDSHLVEYFPDLALKLRGNLINMDDLTSIKYKAQEAAISMERCSMNKTQLNSFGAIARNIIEELAITFKYRAVGQLEASQRSVHPIVLKQKEGIWYLIGYDLERKALRTFTQAKIQEVFTYPGQYDLPSLKVIQQAQKLCDFSIWDNRNEDSATYLIKVKLFDYAADFVRTHRLHHSQKVKNIDDNTSILTRKSSSQQS